MRVTPDQVLTLVEYMETHDDLTRPLPGIHGRVRVDQQWLELTKILNAVSGGVTKSCQRWKKVWADLKSNTKKKALAIRRRARGTVSGSASRLTLTPIDKRLLALMGAQARAVSQKVIIEELGLDKPESFAQAQDDSHTQENSMDLVIGNGFPELTLSPQPSTSQPSNIWHTPSKYQIPTPLSPPMPAAASPPSPSPPSPISTSPAAPVPPSPAESAPSSLPPQSPAAPTSPSPNHRPRMLVRTQEPTLFARAASKLAAAEVRRLELEKLRLTLQHERDMRELEVQHERGMKELEIKHQQNEIYSVLLNVLRSGLDYYLSRKTEPMND